MKKFFLFLILFLSLNLVSQEVPLEWQKIIKVTGTGAINYNDTNFARAKAMGRRAAMMDAYRLLLENVMGTKIESETKIEDFVTVYDKIKNKVEGHIRGMRAIDTRYLDDGTVEVDVILNLADLWLYFEKNTFFETFVFPGSNVFIIDASGSMLEKCHNKKFTNRWEMAKYELKKVISNLELNTNNSSQYFGIIFFDDKIKSYFNIAYVTEENKELSFKKIDSLHPNGATNYYVALEKSIEWVKLSSIIENNRKTIYILGDGEPNRGARPYWDKLFELAKIAKSNGINVNVIYCGDSKEHIEKNMRTLSKIGGGIYKKH